MRPSGANNTSIKRSPELHRLGATRCCDEVSLHINPSTTSELWPGQSLADPLLPPGGTRVAGLLFVRPSLHLPPWRKTILILIFLFFLLLALSPPPLLLLTSPSHHTSSTHSTSRSSYAPPYPGDPSPDPLAPNPVTFRRGLASKWASPWRSVIYPSH